MSKTLLILNLIILSLAATNQAWNNFDLEESGSTNGTQPASSNSFLMFPALCSCGFITDFAFNFNNVTLDSEYDAESNTTKYIPLNGTIGNLTTNASNLTSNNSEQIITTFNIYDLLVYTPAQNSFNYSNFAVEMQFYGNDSTGQQIIISIFANTSNNTWTENPIRKTSAFPTDMPSNVSESFQVDFSDFNSRIMNNINFLVYDVPLNLANTTNSTTALWFVYVPTMWIDNTTTQAFININNQALNQSKIPPVNGSNPFLNAAYVTRICWLGYYQLTLPFNYGLWFAVVITIIYFMFTLSFENIPVDDPDYTTNAWTHHPLISIMTVGNNVFTRKSRCSLLWVNIINICMINAICYAQYGYNNSTDILLYALYSCLISIGLTYLHGILLRLYYINKTRFFDLQQEKFDEDAQFYLFIFYFLVFLWVWGGNIIFVWQMGLLNPMTSSTLSNYWVASFFISLALDWLLFDPICAFLAKSGLFESIFKWKGYIYDSLVCHHGYLNDKKKHQQAKLKII